jgi:hypothetical protein
VRRRLAMVSTRSQALAAAAVTAKYDSGGPPSRSGSKMRSQNAQVSSAAIGGPTWSDTNVTAGAAAGGTHRHSSNGSTTPRSS